MMIKIEIRYEKSKLKISVHFWMNFDFDYKSIWNSDHNYPIMNTPKFFRNINILSQKETKTNSLVIPQYNFADKDAGYFQLTSCFSKCDKPVFSLLSYTLIEIMSH